MNRNGAIKMAGRKTRKIPGLVKEQPVVESPKDEGLKLNVGEFLKGPVMNDDGTPMTAGGYQVHIDAGLNPDIAAVVVRRENGETTQIAQIAASELRSGNITEIVNTAVREALEQMRQEFIGSQPPLNETRWTVNPAHSYSVGQVVHDSHGRSFICTGVYRGGVGERTEISVTPVPRPPTPPSLGDMLRASGFQQTQLQHADVPPWNIQIGEIVVINSDGGFRILRVVRNMRSAAQIEADAVDLFGNLVGIQMRIPYDAFTRSPVQARLLQHTPFFRQAAAGNGWVRPADMRG